MLGNGRAEIMRCADRDLVLESAAHSGLETTQELRGHGDHPIHIQTVMGLFHPNLGDLCPQLTSITVSLTDRIIKQTPGLTLSDGQGISSVWIITDPGSV